MFRSFSAARLRYTAARYDAESRLNQAIAGIYELQVRQNNFTAEQHHRRSGKFFYGMLAAQMAVIISTFCHGRAEEEFPVVASPPPPARRRCRSRSTSIFTFSRLRRAEIYFTGRVMRMVVPRPGRDKMRICPWCVSMIRPTMARPMPVPLALVVRQHGLERALLLLLAHAAAGVLEGHRRPGAVCERRWF